MATLVTDPDLERGLRAGRAASDGDKWNEVWDGVLVMPTLPNVEHQLIQAKLVVAVSLTVATAPKGDACAGVNVTDRHPDWKENYRGPDLVVYLEGNPAVNHDTHIVGGPDFLVEIISPGEDPRQKLDFYAKVKTREVLIVDRYPWALELYQFSGGKLSLVGRADVGNSAVLASGVLPLRFELRDGTPRPTILVTHTATGQTWTA